MNTSQGEAKVIKLLKEADIPFEREKSFKDLKHGLFKYDFYVQLIDHKVLVEVDGVQHFEFVSHYHKNRQGFLKNQEHDRRKNSYALSQNLPLYRIPYWDLDSLTYAGDLFQDKYLVKNRNHNDYLRNPYKQ